MLRRACLTVLFVVLLPATVQAFDHHHHHSSSHGSGCSSSHSSHSSSSSSGGAIGGFGGVGTLPASGHKHVFVTSTTYSGALGGVYAADLHCQSSATEAGLSGRYRAWISGDGSDASSRISGDGPWYTTAEVVAFASASDLSGAPRAPLLTEHHADSLGPGASAVWTGTDADGKATGEDCEGWTNATSDVVATTGTATEGDTDWGGGGGALHCNAKAPLICFEQ